jgi:hypothetical protein
VIVRVISFDAVSSTLIVLSSTLATNTDRPSWLAATASGYPWLAITLATVLVAASMIVMVSL